ncbi:MAG: hypothetical protein JJE22_01190 [Bacteroidia bacterium]|nr:hypothetical protein [Bacteroidia bacterium]
MKKIIVFISLFVTINASAQNIPVEDTIAKPAITEIGKPDGEKIEMKIGKEGGSFMSSDGKIRLVFPEGALSKKTTISIQPTTNLAPNGNGKAYKMEPSGINFQQPVQIIFNYTENETEGNSPLLLGIAMQDDKGLWSSLNKAVVDTVAKTLKAEIRHFSSYVNFSRAKIDPASARVKVNGSRRLKIVGAFTDDTDEDVDLVPLLIEYPDMKWSVNGIANGNSSVGIISASQNGSAIFQAPAQIPQQNPVAVTAQPDYSSAFNNRYHVSRLVSNITIYDDAYEVKMVAAITGGSPKAWTGVISYKDEGSFIVSLEKNRPAVINIKNHFEVFTNNCYAKTILNPNTCTGILHVAGTRQIKVTPADPPGQPFPIVEIWFLPYPIELTRYKQTCPPPPGVKETVTATIDLSNMAMLMFMGKPAIPQYIKFIAKDEEQIILESPRGVSEIYYKIWVKKVKEE